MNLCRCKLVSKVAVVFASAFVSSLAFAEDPYVVSDGLSGINTGYYMKGGVSRVELDYQLTDESQSGQFRLIGMPGGETHGTIIYFTGTALAKASYLRIYVNQINGGGIIGDKSFNAVDTIRHTASIDLKNGKLSVLTQGAISSGDLKTSSSPSFVAKFPITICGQFTDATMTEFQHSHVKTRIYGVKFYEDDILVRNFIPAKSGEKVGLFDPITRKFVEGGEWEASDNVMEVSDNVMEASSACVIMNGTSVFNTGYRLKGGVSRVELDCVATELTSQARYFDYGCPSEKSLQARVYINANGNTRFTVYQDLNSNGTIGEDDIIHDVTVTRKGDQRTTWIVDLSNNKCGFAFDGGYSDYGFTVESSSGIDADYPFAIGGLFKTDDFSETQNRAKINIYSVRIFESGKLVRNFIPAVRVKDDSVGLYDVITRTFILPTGGACTYSGGIEKVDDAYILSNGTTGMSTGYRMKGGVSRVEMDYALVDAETAQQRMMGYGDSDEKIRILYYLRNPSEGSSVPNPTLKINDKWPGYWNNADTKRYTVYVDFANKILGGPGYRSDGFDKQEGVTATYSLPVFGTYVYKDAQKFASNCAKMKVYSIRFYENYVNGGMNKPVRELIPYSKDGIVGFYDTVSGEIVSNEDAETGAFTFHGDTVDGKLMVYIMPDHAAKLKVGETTMLKAYAPNATSYRWFRNGVEIPDETGDTLTVEWRSKGQGGVSDSYTVKAVYDNSGLETAAESESSAPATVRNSIGTIITIL